MFLPAWHRQLLTGGTRQRKRTSRLTLGEIMTILIYFTLILCNPRGYDPLALNPAFDPAFVVEA